MKFFVLALAASLLISGAAFSQPPAISSSAPIDYEAVRQSRVVSAIRITGEISLDGRLDEPAWKLASPATGFIQMAPRPGEPARQPTEVRFLYDDTNLYVGVTCFQSEDAPIVVNDLVQDFNFGQSDAVNLILDTLHDRRSGFMFMTNPGGGQAGRPDQRRRRREHRLGWRVGRKSQPVCRRMDRRVRDSLQDGPLHQFPVAGMGIQHDQGRSAPERNEQLGAHSRTLQRHPGLAGGHAART